MTSEGTRFGFARVCVELDTAQAPVHQFQIRCRSLSSEPVTIRVEYEWKPKRCPQCCLFGHICQDSRPQPCRAPSKDLNSDVRDQQIGDPTGRRSVPHSPPPPDVDTTGPTAQVPQQRALQPPPSQVTDIFPRDGKSPAVISALEEDSHDDLSNSDSDPDSASFLEDDQDRIMGFDLCPQNRKASLPSSSSGVLSSQSGAFIPPAPTSQLRSIIVGNIPLSTDAPRSYEEDPHYDDHVDSVDAGVPDHDTPPDSPWQKVRNRRRGPPPKV